MGKKYDDADEAWSAGYGGRPPETGVRHAMPGLDGVLPCCGRPYSQIGADHMSADSKRVNCPG